MILAAVAVALSVVSGTFELPLSCATAPSPPMPDDLYRCVFEWPANLADDGTEWYVAVLAVPSDAPEWAFLLRRQAGDQQISVELLMAERRIAGESQGGTASCPALRQHVGIRKEVVTSEACASLASLARDLQALDPTDVPGPGEADDPIRATTYTIRVGTRESEVVAWDDAAPEDGGRVLARWAEKVRSAAFACARGATRSAE